MAVVLSIWQNHWELVTALVAKELKVRYKGTFLGYVWSIIHPLALTFIFALVFKDIFKTSIPHFHLFLLSALFPWNWLSASVAGAATSFVDNAILIKKVRFPRLLIPLATVLNNMVHFLLSLPVFLAFSLVAGVFPSWTWLAGVPLLIVLELAFVFGVALAVASFNVYFRDVAHLVGVVLNLWFYATPVVYSLDMLPARVQHVLAFNPATYLLTAWRDLMLHNALDIATITRMAAISAGALVCGLLVFRRLERGFADVL